MGAGPVDPSAVIYPMPACLPMGFTRSFFFLARDADETTASEVLDSTRIMRDHGLQAGRRDGSLRHYVHVDNLGVISDDSRAASDSAESLIAAFESKGLKMHDASLSSTAAEALGLGSTERVATPGSRPRGPGALEGPSSPLLGGDGSGVETSRFLLGTPLSAV